MGNAIGEGSVLASKYRLIRQIGVGAMGSVWVAENLAIEAPVAVKLLHTALADDLQAVKRFELEAKSAARLRHRNIVSVFDLGALDDGAPFIVMELMQGESLERVMQRSGRLQAEELLGVVLPVLGALSVAHANQIIHRDLKPENIFLSVDPDGSTTPKIVDFGVSKMATIDRGTRMTRTGMIVGTPIYMPPEQARGHEVDGRADLWAVGVIMYEALSGLLPYDGDNYNTLVASILTQEAKALATVAPDVDPELSVLVMRALKRDLAERYASADVFAAELGAWLVRRGMPVPPRCPEVSVVHNAEPVPPVGAAAERPRRPDVAVARAARASPSLTTPRPGSPLRGVLLGAAVTAVAMGGGVAAFLVARGDPPEAAVAVEDAPERSRAPASVNVPSSVVPSAPLLPTPSTLATTSAATHVATTGVVHTVSPVVPAPVPPPPAPVRVVGANAPTPAPVAPSVTTGPMPPPPVATRPMPPPPPVATRPMPPPPPVATRPMPPPPPVATRPMPPPPPVATPTPTPPVAPVATRERPRRPARERPPIAPLVPPRTGPRLPTSPGF